MKLTKKQAARFLLYRHGLLAEPVYNGKAGALNFIRDIGGVQFDPVDACGKNAELVLHSRVKGFQKKDLDELLYVDRVLVDYWDKCMCILPVSVWPYLKRMRQSCMQGYYSRPEVAAGYAPVFAAIQERGALCSSDVDIPQSVEWPWGVTALSRAAMESLFYRGELIIHHKKGVRKYYDIPERHLAPLILSADDPNQTLGDYHAWHIKRRIGAVGLLWKKPSDAFLGIRELDAEKRNNAFRALEVAGEIYPLEVEGIPTVLYVRKEELPSLEAALSDAQYPERMELIAPLDCLLWDRRLIEAVFGFDYRWEIYTPEAKRKFGYYVLPLLFCEDFIGRVEAVNDRKNKRLLVKNVWLEKGKKLPKRAFRAYIANFAVWNNCKEIVYEPGSGI
jgi:uncharacterized protein YcaQ